MSSLSNVGTGYSAQIQSALRSLRSGYTTSQNLAIAPDGYVSFGVTDPGDLGDSGYGLRDLSGTLQYKNAGGAWTSFPSSSGAPSDATYLLKVANASLPNAQAMGALASGLTFNTTLTGVQSVVPSVATNQVLTSNGIGVAPVYSATPTVTSLTATTSLISPTWAPALGAAAVTGTLTASGILKSTDTTDSVSVTTGSIVGFGGLGIAKAAYIGTTLNVAQSAVFGAASSVTANNGPGVTTAIFTATGNTAANYGAYKTGNLWLIGRTSATDVYVASNTDLFTATITGAGAYYSASAGAHAWATAPSVTAGNAQSFTTLMSLSANGILSLTSTNGTGVSTAYMSAEGVTSTFYGGYKTGNLWLISRTSGAESYVTSNTDLFTATITGASSYYQQLSGVHNWYSAASVSAGAAVTPVLGMSLSAAGLLSVTTKVNAVTGFQFNGTNGFTGTGSYTTLTIQGGIITNAV